MITACVFTLACGGKDVDVANSVPAPIPEVYATTKVNDVELTLRNENGLCALEYTTDPRYQRPGAGSNTVVLDMESPCNFVRLPGRPEEPQVYAYPNEGANGRKVLLIVGGEYEPESGLRGSDQFMPQGCGSWMQKIIVDRSSIDVQFPALKPGGTTCPSHGMDEVFFAA